MRFVLVDKALKEKRSFLIWDVSASVDHARKLADDGNTVYYYTEWTDPTPKFMRYASGLGYEGVVKVKNFYKFVDKVDCICFFYIGRGDLCSWLRGRGYTCFGAGRGERLERDRAWAKDVQKKIGLPTQDYKIIKGIDNVIKYVKKSPGKYIKLNIWRGDQETFFAEDGEAAGTILNPMKMKLGPFSDTFEFIVENEVPDVVVESGWDLFFNGIDYLKPYLWGFLSGGIYLGKYVDSMPKSLEKVADAIKPLLMGLDYRGAISVEVLMTKKRVPYVLDWTCRIPYPLGILYTHSLNNYSEVIWKIAKGENVDLDVKDKYVGAIDFTSTHALQNWVKVTYPPKLSDQIRIQGSKYMDNEYVVPGYELIAEGVTCKGSIGSVLDDLKKLSGKVGAFGYEPKIDEASLKEVLSSGESVGLKL